MKFLHISDIHFNPADDGRATRDLRKKFKEYVREKGITDIDQVFFTGDFRHAKMQINQDADTVAQNAVKFLFEIAECVGATDPDHIHIVPGNHDLDREKETKKNNKYLKDIYDQYDSDDGCFTGCVEDGFAALDYLRGRFGFFEKCVELSHNKVWAEFDQGLLHRYQNFEDYSIVYLNTAIASGSDCGRHNLLIGTNDFEKVIQKTAGRPIFILAHNPLSHLKDDEQNIIKNILKDNHAPVIWFCGDVHDTRYDKNYEIACLSVGCMIKQNGTEASFFVGEFNKFGGVHINAHGYNAKHGGWQSEEALTKRVNESIPEELKSSLGGIIPQVNNLPERNCYFTGRDEQLKIIADRFKKNHKIVVKQTVSGLGGIGKTQLAREYAYRHGENYRNGIWEINAESAISVYAGFIEFAKKCELGLSTDFKEEELCQAVKTWMCENDKWLIIFDNLDNEDVIAEYVPQNNIHGDILVTTRSADIDFGSCMDLSVFELDEAVEFLDNRLKECNHLDENSADLKRELVDRLGRLPLALEQAAAYIKVTRTSYARYLDLLSESGMEAFEINDMSYNEPEFYTKSVTTTWEISFQTIALEGSKQLFYLCAYLASDKIPVKLFVEGREILPEPIRGNLSTILDTNKIVTELRRYSLTDGNAEYINIHRLVQEVVRTKLSAELQWARNDLRLLEKMFSFEYGNEASHENFVQLIAHVEAFLNTAAGIMNDAVDEQMIAMLYSTGGQGKGYLGQYYEAVQWHQKALDIRERLFGEKDTATAATYNNLGTIYVDIGKSEKALALYQKALEVFEEELGPEHDAVATAYNNIAGAYDSCGDYKDALMFYNKALAIRQKSDDADTDSIANIYSNIAFVYNRLADYEAALKYNKKARDIYIREVGAENVKTAVSYANLAYTYANMGKYKEALKWHEKALAIRKRVLGDENPYTIGSYSNMAHVYAYMGEYNTALEIFNNVMCVCESTLGVQHPDTALAYDNVAGMYYRMGEYQPALEYYFRALDIRKTILGPDHLDTAVTYNNIGATYESVGMYDEALKYYGKALNIRKQRLGINHPDTADSYNNIASVYDVKADDKKAINLYYKALKIREDTLGKDHPDTADSYNNVASALDMQGMHDEALELYNRALVIRKKIFGENHPETAALYNNIATTYGKKGMHAEALDMYQKALDIYLKVFGKMHPDTAAVYNNIGTLYDSFGQYSIALEWLQEGLEICIKTRGYHSINTLDSYVNMAAVLEKLCQYDKALDYYNKALTISEKELGKDDLFTLYIQACMEDIKM